MKMRALFVKTLSVVGVLIAAASSQAAMITFEGVAPSGGTQNVNPGLYGSGNYNVYIPKGTFVDSAYSGVTDGTNPNSGSDYLYSDIATGFTVSRTDGVMFDAVSFMASEFLATTSTPQQFRALGITGSGVVEQIFVTDGTFGFETFAFNSDFTGLYSLQIFDNQGLIAWDNVVVQPSPVPEPASLALFGLGGVGLACLARRRRKQVENS